MTAGEKEVADKVLSTATLASFAVPGAGAVLATGVGVVQVLFDVFCPAAPSDPNLAPLSAAELQQAVQSITTKIDENQWQLNVSLMQSHVLAHNDLFLKFWTTLGDVGLTNIDLWESAPGKNDGATYVGDVPDAGLVKELETYFDTGNPEGTWMVMDTAFRVLKDPASTDTDVIAHRRNETTRLLCLIAATWISYLKARIIWDWAHNNVLKWDKYVVYLNNNRLYNGGTSAFRANHDQPLSPLAPGETQMDQPDWTSWSGYDKNPVKRKGGPVKDLIDAVDKILEYVEGDGSQTPPLFTTMSNKWYTERFQKIRDRLSKISIATDGSNYWYNDTDGSTGGLSPKVAHRQLAEIHMEAKRGALIAYLWDYWTQSFALENVDGEAIVLFGQAIAQWKMARASVNFAVHEVKKGDTLASVAKDFYKDPLYAIAVFDANKPDLQIAPATTGGPQLEIDRVTLIEGQMLKLPDKSDLDYTIQTVKSGAWLKGIAHDFYGSELYDQAIFDANTDNLLVTPYNFGVGTEADVERVWLFAGQLIKLPSKQSVGYTLYTVNPGDTLSSIAVDFYGHKLYDLAIYKANERFLKLDDFKVQAQGVCPVDAVLPLSTGQILTLWRRDDTGFFVYTITAQDTFPDTIADKFYEDTSLSPEILSANMDVLLAANLIGPGKNPGAGFDIRIPILGSNRNTSATL